MLALEFQGLSAVVKCWLQDFRILELGFTRGFRALLAEQLAVLSGRFKYHFGHTFKRRSFEDGVGFQWS